MNDIFDFPLKLRRDAIYMKTEKGIVFRSRKGAFAFSGSMIYSTFQQLLPYLNGSIKGADLVASVPRDGQRAVSDLLQTLVQRDVLQVTDGQDAQILERSVVSAFEPQIEFIRHYADRPHERFHAFRETKLLLTGSGVAFASAGAALLRNGLRTLHVSCSSSSNLELLRAEGAKLRERNVQSGINYIEESSVLRQGGLEMVLYCSERPDLATVRRLNAQAAELGFCFLPAVIYGGNMLVGPSVDPLKTGCWECAMLRWSDNLGGDIFSVFWKQVALGQTVRARAAEVSEIAAHMLGNTAAMEIFKLCIGQPESETRATLLKQNLSTLETETKIVLPHPDCGACQPAPSWLTPEGDWQSADAVNISPKDCLVRWLPFFDEEFGLFQKFDDDSIEQIPLRLSPLAFCLPATETEGKRNCIAMGWSLEHSDAARLHALRKGIEARAFLSAPVSLRNVASQTANGNRKKVDPSQLASWLGASWPAATISGYLEFIDLHTSETLLVPAGAVHPDFDEEGWFDRSAGLGAGLTRADALRQAVLSLYQRLAVTRLVHGSLRARRWEQSAVSPSKNMEYLLSTAEHLGLSNLPCAIAVLEEGVYSALALPLGEESLCRVDDLIICTEFSLSKALEGILAETIARSQLSRIGRQWQDIPVYDGLCAKAEFFMNVDSQAPVLAEDKETTLAQFAARLAAQGKSLLWCDVTPPDIGATGTFRLVSVLLASETNL